MESTTLPVTGTVDPTSSVTVNGKAVHVASDGTFVGEVELALGKSDVVIAATDPDGVMAEITWPLEVARRQFFAVGVVDIAASSALVDGGMTSDGAMLAGMTDDSTTAIGPLLLHGRATGMVRGRVSKGKWFDDLQFTAHIDTGKERETQPFFANLDDTKEFSLFGDTAGEARDVNSRGKFYLHVKADESTATIGSVHTSLVGGLVHYDRTVDGVVVDGHRTIGRHEASARAFATHYAPTTMRDVNWYRATGGSLYYLRYGFVAEGSERLRIVVRDRDTGMLLLERELVRNRDYSIDYQAGRVLLAEPLASTAGSSWLMGNLDAQLSPLDGHPVYVEARFEHSDPSAAPERAVGGYARNVVSKRLAVGAA